MSRTFLLVAALFVGAFTLGYVKPTTKHVLADGSDPMPLCRPSPNKPCPKQENLPPAVILQDRLQIADGGPIPLCPICKPGGAKCCGSTCMMGKCTK
jgi:hypothetical protein